MSKKEKKHELVFGIHPIVELLKAKRRSIATIYTTKDHPKNWDSIERLLPKSVQKQYVTRDILHRLAQTTDHQGVVAYATPFQYRSRFFEPSRQPFLVMLDGIQDPHNLGAILRSAYCTGVDGVIVSKKGSSPLTPTALKASAGLAEHMDIYQTPSSATAVNEIKKSGYALYLATLDGSDATKVDYADQLCIVVGSEGFGISPDIMSRGTKITLPQRRADISYNASVAAGILLFIASGKIHKI